MKKNKSTSNLNKKIRISKNTQIDRITLEAKEKNLQKNNKFRNEKNKYDNLNENIPNLDNDQNNIIKEYEIEKIKPKNLSKIQFKNNNNIILESKKYIKTSNNLINNTDNNSHINIKSSNTSYLINGGGNEKLTLKITNSNKNPIKLRKFTSNINKKNFQEDVDLYNDKNLQTISTLNTIKETKISRTKKEEELVNQLEEEIQKLKEENTNIDDDINNLKNQTNENINEKTKTTTENSFDNDKNDNNSNLNSLEENDIFDKLRTNYINNKNLVNELTHKNEELKITVINQSNSIIRRGSKYITHLNNKRIRKDIQFSIISNKNDGQEIVNNYIEDNLAKNNRDCFMIKQLDTETKHNINLMLKMIINSNNCINEDECISLFMNNLLDYYNTIKIFSSKYLNIINSSDIKLLKKYFKSVGFGDDIKFNISNIFNEIISFFDDEIKNLEEVNLLKIYNNHENIIKNIIKKCKKKDFLDTGLIEFHSFKNIFEEYHNQKELKKNKDDIFKALLYNMKKNNKTNEHLGLFFLSYMNLCDIFKINNKL
jgi:hypothetical protein